jgi:hypothetical protein
MSLFIRKRFLLETGFEPFLVRQDPDLQEMYGLGFRMVELTVVMPVPANIRCA